MPTWIPYWTFYTLRSAPNQLTVVSPPDIVLFIIMNVLFYLAFLRHFFRDWKAGTITPQGMLLMSLVYLVGLGLVCGHGTITLDRNTNTATVHRVRLFFIPTTTHIPLSEVIGARLYHAPGSEILSLQTNSAGSYSISSWRQMGGQAYAANSINEFLSQSQ